MDGGPAGLGVPIKSCSGNEDGTPCVGVWPGMVNESGAPENVYNGGGAVIGLVGGGSPDRRGAIGTSPAAGLTPVVGATSAAVVGDTS